MGTHTTHTQGNVSYALRHCLLSNLHPPENERAPLPDDINPWSDSPQLRCSFPPPSLTTAPVVGRIQPSKYVLHEPESSGSQSLFFSAQRDI